MASMRFYLYIPVFLMLTWAGCSDSSEPKSIPPNVSVPPGQTALAGQEYTRQINIHDPQGLKVQLYAEGLPVWLQLFSEEAMLRGTPSANDGGLHSFLLTADNGLAETTIQVVIRVFASEAEIGLQQHVETVMQAITPGMRGVSVAVVDDKGILYTAYAGNIGTGTSHPLMGPQHKFRVASVTKPMTAALILKLAEQRKLGLDDILLDRYETLLPNANRMTLRQMLSHTAGVFDHLNSNAFWGSPQFSSSKVWTIPEIVQFAVTAGPRFTPGFGYGYSNTAFCVLGGVIEEATGLTIAEAFDQMLFEPMSLENSLYDDFSGQGTTIPDLAFNARSYEYHLSSACAAGAAAATPSDVALFGWKLYGGRYLSAELTSQLDVNLGARLGGQNYGLGTRIWTSGGIRNYGHTGSLMDYRNMLMYIPELDISIAVHTHHPHSNWFTLVDNIFDHVVDNFSSRPAKRLPGFEHIYDSRE
jgi:D-alanyl-D-alanine carboxypeptidase